jgi:hypothetical protein
VKTAKKFWNYVDIVSQVALFLGIIVFTYYICENLERYIYRYTIFPFVAFVCVFTLGVLLGKAMDRNSRGKPIGFFSKRMAKARKKKRAFIFSDDEETYTPRKQIVEEIKSGKIVHVKQYSDSDFSEDDFKDIYNIDISNLLDSKMNEEDKENK